MNVGNAPVQRIFNRDHGTADTPFDDAVQRILERKTGYRQPIGIKFAYRLMRIGAGRALKRDSAFGPGGGRLVHCGNALARKPGIVFHGPAAYRQDQQ